MSKTATYALIESQTISSATATLTFSSIPTTYTDLILVCNIIDTAINVGAIQVGNGSLDTGSNYSDTRLIGNGSAVASFRDTSATYIYIGTTSSVRGTQIYNFLDYANTTTYKTVVGRAADSGYRNAVGVGLWRSTAAINTIKIFGGSNWNGSTFKLYGIQAGNA